jgi:hypothetical protein
MNTLRCVAGTCAPGQACCFNGDVTDDEVCPKRITLRDSECVDIAGTPADAVCRDQSNGIQHHIMCQVDEDCAPYGATCQQARMDHVGRLMGICVR